ncbi:protein of unknown function [Mucilaginibacter lappiensis]|uniref:Uncharacterized protein n=1 Tax=Mucilaginibacter lappiensis TaxID=354630 RepID=A0ABR6PJJ4_9SPHI|nr:DUF4747 family protein [Mucilaginibacter lappiensis]MBB6108406.1 hypothetical protein [Mucilaginibacter lappiensis]SIQ39027.1 protein of unknown function [Mucilaginibacter lappiensis]
MAIKKFKFYVFNIKLQSLKEGDERIIAYENLIKAITSKPHFTRLNKNEAITMYKPFEREEKGLKYFYGNLGKGISFFDKDEIRVINNNKVSKEVVNKDNILEPITGEYIFIPSIHRLGLLKTPNSPTVGDVERFLREHLGKYIAPDEKIEIDFEKEPSIIDEIFNAEAVYKLSYEITYTNSDALPAQGELFDEYLHENNIGKLSVIAEADHNQEGLKIKDVNFLGGGIEVARNNGVIKSAKIKTPDSRKIKTVSNTQKPLLQEAELINENDIKPQRWFNKFIHLYRGI